MPGCTRRRVRRLRALVGFATSIEEGVYQRGLRELPRAHRLACHVLEVVPATHLGAGRTSALSLAWRNAHKLATALRPQPITEGDALLLAGRVHLLGRQLELLADHIESRSRRSA